MFYMMPFMYDNRMFMNNLEDMYPETYRTVYPEVKRVCDTMDTDLMRMPTKAEIENMTDMVYDAVEDKVKEDYYDTENVEYDKNIEENTAQTSQYGYYTPYRRPYQFRRFRRRRLLRDLVGTLLLRELFRRRGLFYY